jgi:hypothetical protein
MSNFVALAAVVLFACKGKDNGTDTGQRTDHDVDGFYADEDCNDDDALVNPDATELCDEVDNDCDSLIDGEDDDLDDGIFYYSDSDSDGFGDDASGLLSCELVVDAVTIGGDCDDVDPDINPNAQEICDTKDNDCDTLSDDDDTDTYGQLEYKVDADGDGWGDEKAAPERYCENPGAGFVSYDASTLQDCDDASVDFHPYAVEECTDTEDYNCDGSVGYDDVDKDGSPACEDCDDLQPAAFPGNTEICDSLDNDCNTYTDDADPELADGTTYFVDDDADSYGDPAVFEIACVAPVGFVNSGDDCDDSNDDVHPGAAEICDRFDDDCDDVLPSDESDDDGDTYVECELAADCDDTNLDIHPGAGELCSTAGVDDDCDGSADESSALDASTWYYDFDGDNYGGVGVSTVACVQPADYADNADDCDDGSSVAHPGATELCNGEDDDCDSALPTDEVDGDGDTYMVCEGDCDDTDSSAFPGSTFFYRDTDGDGYGIASATTTDCTVPSGYSAVSGDCLDSNANVHPGATELCNAMDDDCNGTVDDSYATDATTWFADADDDDFGDFATTSTACTRPTGSTKDHTDCDDTDDTINPDAVEVCSDGIDNDCDGVSGACEEEASVASEIVWAGESSNDNAGISLAAGGDVDADGINELLVGAKLNDDAGTDAGAAYLIWGPMTAATSAIDAIDEQKVTGQANITTADKLGSAVAFAGDMIGGDGYGDIAIGAGNRDVSASGDHKGQVYILSGIDLGHTEKSVTGFADEYLVRGTNSFDYLGSGLARGGDFDDDGQPDLWLGAAGAGTSDVGIVYLLRGSLTTSATVFSVSSVAAMTITGDAPSDTIGSVLATGDFDGDGLADVAIGDSKDKDASVGLANAGAVHIFLGHTSPSGTTNTASADADVIAASGSDLLGASVANAGDTDGDGTDDLIAGATGVDTTGTDAGACYVVPGSTTIGDLDGIVDDVSSATMNGGTSRDKAGASCNGNGDFDGDGEIDFVAGATSYDTDDLGAVYLVMGPRSGSMTLDLEPGNAAARFVGDNNNDQMGARAMFTGQITSSYNEGIFYANELDDLGGVDSGAAYIVFDIGL